MCILLRFEIIIWTMSKRDLKAFGSRVKGLRLERNLTQQELAEKSTYQRIL